MLRFRQGLFVVSLDFELYWGVRDKRSLEQYGEFLRGVPGAVEAMLALFSRYGIHVTWSVVGFLFFRSKEQLMAQVPKFRPTYNDQNLCPYRYLESSEVFEPELHFAPDLLSRIQAVPGQEVGTHTFSHLYCLEPRVGLDEFEADLSAASEFGREFGCHPRSLVFPRNQWRRDFLEVLPRHGIHCFRGNEAHWLYRASSSSGLTLWKRGLKLLDTYLPISGDHVFGPERCGELPYDLPASRFLRPYSRRLRYLEPLKERRIINSMRQAAKQAKAFHLWWHPHNFGRDLELNLRLLEIILQEYQALEASLGLKSLNMAEVAQGLSNGELVAP